MKVLKPICGVVFIALTPLWGQEARGTLLGRVTDPSNAAIAGAKVVATNADTGVRATSNTNESGDYLLPFLIPGPYSISVEAQGFKTYTRAGIAVRVNERIPIDVQMELGDVSQRVEVSVEAPLLDTSTASMGYIVGSRTILELPLKDGMVLTMATFSPGVIFTPETAGFVRPFDTSSPSTMTIDGTRSGSNEFMMDGAPNMQGTQVAYSPPPGVVDEFKVQAATFDASYGFMSGAGINMSLKSGANNLHGQVYYFMQNPALNANSFLSNRAGTAKRNFRLHRWGGSASGPVYLPKLYNGRNKTFWMYGYEGIWSFDPTPFTTEAVPIAAQRTGDFSGLLALGARYQMYDPYSTTPAPNGRFQRQPLAGNVVPASRINPVAAKIAPLWNQPNQAGTVDGTNNSYSPRNSQDSYFNHIVRVDHNISERQRFYVRTNFTTMRRPEEIRHNMARGDEFYRYNRGFSFDDVWTLSPGFFINTRYTLTRFITGYDPYQMNWDLAGLGFSPTFLGQINGVDPRGLRLPRIDIDGYSSLSVQTLQRRATNIHEAAANLTSIIGSHTLRYGIVYRNYQANQYNFDNSSGLLVFGTNWTRGPLDTSAAAPMGQSMASFLYGLPTGGAFPIVDSYAEQAPTQALYVQDDWKISRKLTLSLGLRHELPWALTERFDRTIKGFDATVASPIEPQAIANYARNPIPEVPVSSFKVKGGLNFAGVGGNSRALWSATKTNFMPRVGFAYSITPKTVVRGGYGIFFEPIGVTYLNVNQTGFNRSTSLVASLDNGQTYVANLTNPFPSGLLRPLGASGGLSTNLGQGISFFPDDLGYPYMQRWQLAVQREFPGNNLIEVSYVGNRGTRMRLGRDYDPVPRQYLSTSPVRDQQTINYLNEQVPNPFLGLLPGTSLSSTTVSRAQLLRPFPEFTGVGAEVNQGYSWYHSLQVRYEKRLSAGLSSSLSYTWSKLMEARTYLNATDPLPERVISDQDRTHRLTVTWLYELPFGKGRRWGGAANKAVLAMIDGWQVQGIYSAQSGGALGFGNAIFTGDLKNIPLPDSERTVERWFNVDAGFERNSARALDANIRTFPSRFNGIRADGVNNMDLSVIKNTTLKEGVQLQFRAEAINALNHPQFTAPNTTPTSTAFGTVTNEFSWPRVIQFGMKLLF